MTFFTLILAIIIHTRGDDNSVMFLLTADRWINHPELMSGLPTEWRNKANALNIKEDDNPILFFFKEKNKLE